MLICGKSLRYGISLMFLLPCLSLITGSAAALSTASRQSTRPLLSLAALANGMVDIAGVPSWRVITFWSATCPCVKACERYSLVPFAGKYKALVSFFAIVSDG